MPTRLFLFKKAIFSGKYGIKTGNTSKTAKKS